MPDWRYSGRLRKQQKPLVSETRKAILQSLKTKNGARLMGKTTAHWVKAARLENAAGVRFKRLGNEYYAALCFRMARSNMRAAREVMA